MTPAERAARAKAKAEARQAEAAERAAEQKAAVLRHIARSKVITARDSRIPARMTRP